MKKQYFDKCLELGKQWESVVESWMKEYFSVERPGWLVENSKHVHRDSDGDQYPDYVIRSTFTDQYYFLDAKKRTVYRHAGHDPSFGFDDQFYRSYTNIAKKHSTKVFVAFGDLKFDPLHLYIVDLDQPVDFVWNYGKNGYGESLCHRWYIRNLKIKPLKIQSNQN